MRCIRSSHLTQIPERTRRPPLVKQMKERSLNRQFQAEHPNQLWVADFSYAATCSGVVFVAFVIDVFARRIVGWQVSRSTKAQPVLDALEQALWAGSMPTTNCESTQYLAIRYSERLTQAGIKCSVGSTGDSFDSALAESIIGLFKTEVITASGPWKSVESVEYATLNWVDWFNHRRLLGSIGDVPPAESEQAYYDHLDGSARAA